MQEFDREYCHEVKSACLQAIANTSFCERANPRDMLPAAAGTSSGGGSSEAAVRE